MAIFTDQTYGGGTVVPSSSDTYVRCSFSRVSFSGGTLQLAGGCSMVQCSGTLEGLLLYEQSGQAGNTVGNSVVSVSGSAVLGGLDLETSGLSVTGTVYVGDGVRVGETATVAGTGGWLSHLNLRTSQKSELVGVSPVSATLNNGGGTLQLSPEYSDGLNDPGRCSWTSSDSSVATVSATGLVTPRGIGTCTVSASQGGIACSSSILVESVATFSGRYRSIDMSTWEAMDPLADGVKSYAGGVLFSTKRGSALYSLDMGDSWQVLTFGNNERRGRASSDYTEPSFNWGAVAYFDGWWFCPYTGSSIGCGMLRSQDLKNWYVVPGVLCYENWTSISTVTAADGKSLIGAVNITGNVRGFFRLGGLSGIPTVTPLIGSSFKDVGYTGTYSHMHVPLMVRSGNSFLMDSQGMSYAGGSVSSNDGGSSWRISRDALGTPQIPVRDDFFVATGLYGRYGEVITSPGDEGSMRISRDGGGTWVPPDSLVIDLGLTGAYADPSSYHVTMTNWKPYGNVSEGEGPLCVQGPGGSWYMAAFGLKASSISAYSGTYDLYSSTGEVLLRVDVDPALNAVTLVLEPGKSVPQVPLRTLLTVAKEPLAPLLPPVLPRFSSYSGEIFLAFSPHTRVTTADGSCISYDALKVSYDRGRTWVVSMLGNDVVASVPQRVSYNTLPRDRWGSILSHGGAVVVGGSYGRVYVARPDGSHSTIQGLTGVARTLAMGSSAVTEDGRCLVVSQCCADENYTQAMLSDRGLTGWSWACLPKSDSGWRVAYGNGRFVGVAGLASILSVDGGITWEWHDQSATTEKVAQSLLDGARYYGAAFKLYLREIAFGNGVFVASCGEGEQTVLMTSTDGVGWECSYFAFSENRAPANTISFDGEFFRTLSLNEFGNSVRSRDGVLWEGHETSGTHYAFRQGALPGTHIASLGDGGGEFLRYDNKDTVEFKGKPDYPQILSGLRVGDRFGAADYSWLPSGVQFQAGTCIGLFLPYHPSMGDLTVSIEGLDSSVGYEINWGDGTVSSGNGASATHRYASTVMATSPVSFVTLSRGLFRNDLSGTAIVKPAQVLFGVSCWGAGFTGVRSLSGAFSGSPYMDFIPDTWKGLESLEDATDMFSGCGSLRAGSWGGFSGLYNVKKADGMFCGCSGFAGDIGGLYKVLSGSGASHAGTFLGCAGATGYQSVPADWKN